MHRVPKVVIVGAGFGGLFAAKPMSRLAVELTVIDRHNYHLFQPLLYQVAAAGLAPSDIAWPIRSILRRQKNARVLLDEVQGIDLDSRQVVLSASRIDFDYLILATGAKPSYFGNDSWKKKRAGLEKHRRRDFDPPPLAVGFRASGDV